MDPEPDVSDHRDLHRWDKWYAWCLREEARLEAPWRTLPSGRMCQAADYADEMRRCNEQTIADLKDGGKLWQCAGYVWSGTEWKIPKVKHGA